jgi:hypothetical protein
MASSALGAILAMPIFHKIKAAIKKTALLAGTGAGNPLARRRAAIIEVEQAEAVLAPSATCHTACSSDAATRKG